MTDIVKNARAGSHSSHWGAFRAALNGEELRIAPHPDDPAPSPLLENFTAALRHRARVTAPMVRQGWLERGPGAASARGRETFVEVSWEKASDLVATELRRVYAEHGAGSVFGGSYGWSSAGRFHHAQSQIHRFLNCAGGYVRSVNSYSSAAAAVILPHVIGPQEMIRDEILWADVQRHPDILLCFGGMAAKNGQSSAGGISRHSIVGSLKAARTRGAEFHLFGPQPGDLPAEALAGLEAVWEGNVAELQVEPGSDAATRLANRDGAEVTGDRAVLHFVDANILADVLSGFGPEVLVLSPPELREAVVARLRGVVAAHGDA